MSPPVRYFAAALLAVAPVGPSALLPLVPHGSPDVEPEVVVSFADETIDESSGLVVRDNRLFTVNDSGDGPYLYEVDLGTGQTVAVTTYADEDPVDVEALAPGADGAVWVGDIGDNRGTRGSVRIHRLVPAREGGRVEADSFDLVYPGPAQDAEALLVHPRTERVYVVTKTVMRGGVVFRAPRELVPGKAHELERVAGVPGIVTDGTFLPDGDHVLLRTYGDATLYSYPGFGRVASAPVPSQEQGEAVAIGRDDRMYLTSEGERSDVLVMDSPEPAPAGRASAPGQGDGEGAQGDSATEPSSRYDPQPWMGLGPWGLLLAVLGSGLALGLLWLLLRASRRRSRRRR